MESDPRYGAIFNAEGLLLIFKTHGTFNLLQAHTEAIFTFKTAILFILPTQMIVITCLVQ